MKTFYILFALLATATAWSIPGRTVTAQSTAKPTTQDITASTSLVLSQVSGGNGFYADDWVELKNISNSPQSLNGLSLYYGSATGNFGAGSFALPNVSIAPGQYFLVRLPQSGTSGTALPITPDATAATGAISMSGTSGKIGLVVTSQLSTNTCGATATPCSTTQLGAFVDWVAYGAAGNGVAGNGEGGTSVNNGVAITSTQGAVRKNGGCADTDNNNADFDVVTAPTPRNTSTGIAPCGSGDGSMIVAAIAANPATVSPGSSTLLTVTVIPATTPPSTGITVVGNLTDIGGSATQTFFDDGTNGDATAGDNVFSFFAPIPLGTSGGIHAVSAVASDAEARTVNLNQNLNISVPLPDEDPLIFGNPSNATGNIANENNYLMQKPQYTISYNRSKGEPNWVAWRLDSSWIGGAPRQNDYRPDTSLPAGWYQVTDIDYSGSGYDRGHMCPSGDRTRSIPDNSATFLMTNFVPQLSANNQGPWEEFETYCRSLAASGNEIYIITGPSGNVGTIANGQVVVPAVTWKVVLVLPNGSNDLSRVSRATRAFGIIVPNQPPLNINEPWRTFRVTVDAVENLTGYNFFSAIPINTQAIIERRHDQQ